MKRRTNIRYTGHSAAVRGFTFMELLAGIVLATIIMTIAFQFFIAQASRFEEKRQLSELQQELRWALQYLDERVRLAGNGVPPSCGWSVVEAVDGGSTAPDSLKILGSFFSLVVNTTQPMGNEGSQVKVDNTDNIAEGDLVVISDITYTEIFMVTKINSSHLWHDKFPPWNPSNKLQHRYGQGSRVTVVSYYSFFVDTDDEGRTNLYVETQALEPQILAGDVEDFQVRFKMKGGDWVDEVDANEIYDIRMIELTVRARTPREIPNFVDPVFGDGYKRITEQIVIIPQNIAIM